MPATYGSSPADLIEPVSACAGGCNRCWQSAPPGAAVNACAGLDACDLSGAVSSVGACQRLRGGSMLATLFGSRSLSAPAQGLDVCDLIQLYARTIDNVLSAPARGSMLATLHLSVGPVSACAGAKCSRRE
jgi:hypothetical protein